MSYMESSIPRMGSDTSSNDPLSVNSRVFVGGLNTIEMKKADVEQIFKRYGYISGISMHKGFAFVQFSSPMEARQAVLGEDQRAYSNQTLDVNVVSEPKFRPKKKKFNKPDEAVRSNNIGIPIATTGSSPPPKTFTLPSTEEMHTYDEPDTLICGSCKEAFDSIQNLAEHKKSKCMLKTNCKCQPFIKGPVSIVCATCSQEFTSSWALIRHCQDEHGLSIVAMENEISGNGN